MGKDADAPAHEECEGVGDGAPQVASQCCATPTGSGHAKWLLAKSQSVMTFLIAGSVPVRSLFCRLSVSSEAKPTKVDGMVPWIILLLKSRYVNSFKLPNDVGNDPFTTTRLPFSFVPARYIAVMCNFPSLVVVLHDTQYYALARIRPQIRKNSSHRMQDPNASC